MDGAPISNMPSIDIEKCDQLSVPSFPTIKPESIVSQVSLSDQATQSPSVASQDDEFPDGGWEAWLTVLGAFLALLCTFGQLTSFGTFQSWYSSHQLHSLAPSTISWIGSLQLWVFFFSVSHVISS